MHRARVGRQHARHVAGQPAAGDVGDGMHRNLFEQFQDRLHVDARRGEQYFAQGLVSIRLIELGLLVRDDLAHQGVAV